MSRPIDISSLPDEAKKALDQFKEFDIASFNSSGANGYVMIGKHKVLKTDVAIKIYFHAEHEVDQEPAIIASINHENVLKVFDARNVEKCCSFYLMQAANDGDLFNFLKKYDISTTFSHKLTCQLLSGLAELHSSKNKLVHRDLKPENLLVHDDKIVIADFGSVRKVSDATGHAPASKHSVLYRPPEAFGPGAYFDFSSDIYQVGIIGFLLFGGKLSNILTDHLTNSELKILSKIEEKGDDYETSVYIDSCIQKRASAKTLLNWDSLPFYIPNKIKRILRKAVSSHEQRFKNVSELLSELVKVRKELPDWMVDSEGFCLKNWKGNNYLLLPSKGKVILKKARAGSDTYRIDNSVVGATFIDAYKVMQVTLGLP